MKLINKDILSDINPDKITIILHGANCFHTMGAGIAKYLKDKFPEAYLADCYTPYGDVNKLGGISNARISKGLWIVNCYTQFSFGDTVDVDYQAVYSSLKKVSDIIKNYRKMSNVDVEIRSPQIGCGLAGGDWKVVDGIFEDLLPQAKIYYI